MNRKYFKLWYCLDGRDAYLIWYTNEQDGVVTDSDGKVPCFQSPEDLLHYAESLNLSLNVEDPILNNLDVVAEWLNRGDSESVDCKSFLAAWNLFDDVSRSVTGNFDPEHQLTQKIYDKLFWGNNLPSVMPEGKSYHPEWTKRELKIIKEVLGYGLSLFRHSVRAIASSP